MEDEDRQFYGDPPEPDQVAPDDWTAGQALDVAAQHARRVVWLRARGKDLAEMFKAEHDRLTARALEVLEPIKAEVERRERAIELIHRGLLARGEAGKTLKLPTGPDSKLTADQPDYVVEDEDAFRAWAAGKGLEDQLWPEKPAPERVLNRNELKRTLKILAAVPLRGEPGTVLPVVDSNGEAVPGVKITLRDNRWNYGKAEK